jgi:S-adenosylmethionine:tRNA ribosyltransferase-isomerase
LNIAEFDYELPPERIAQEPLPERDASRLMLLARRTGVVSHHSFRDLPNLLRPGDLLVVNRSRVFPARLFGKRPKSGGRVEVLLLGPVGSGDEWEALVRPGRRLRVGDVVRVGPDLHVRILSGGRGEDARRLVRLEAAGDPWQVVERLGHVPLPPYIARPDRPADRERYQTVYANERGSVAAPTAGLHFTPALLSRLHERGIDRAEIVLHVGPGTFRPVKVPAVEQHRVEPEPFEIPECTARAIAATRQREGRVVCVGSTTVRALETRARPDGRVEAGTGWTDLVVLPGFEFRVTDVLITNFHLPRSSLLLLAAAFAGRQRLLEAYAEAIRLGYRFYSYGDAMLLE